MAALREQLDDLQDVVTRTQSALEEAYRPEATREELAEAIGQALDIISGEDSAEDEDDEGEEDGEDE